MCPPERRFSSSDTHGGFHGAGISCVALQFPDSQVADAIAANAAWTPLPLDETAQALAYGVTREDGGEVFSAGPYLTDDSGDPTHPQGPMPSSTRSPDAP